MNEIGRKLGMVLSLLVAVGLVVTGCTGALTPSPATSTSSPSPTSPATSAPGVTGVPASPTPGLTPVAQKPTYGGLVVVPLAGDPPSYDGHEEVSIQTLALVGAISDRLLHTEPVTGRVVPALAESWEVSPDGLVFTFHLRRGVKWHDGKPFTSADARASLEKIIWPGKGLASPRRVVVGEAVTKVEAPDEATLKVILERPRASFIPAVASCSSSMQPKHILDLKGDMKRDTVGTGPFRFKEHIRGVSWEVVKNPEYWAQGRPYLDGILYYIIPDASSTLAAFKTHRINFWYSGTPASAQIEALKKELGEKISVQTTYLWGFALITFNLTRYPWNDVRVRRAVDLAVDRVAGVKLSYTSAGGIATGIFNPQSPWGIPLDKLMQRPGWRQPKDQDLAEARRLIAEAGVPKGTKVSIMARVAPRYYQDMGVYTKSVLDELGFDSSLRVLEAALIYRAQAAGDYDVHPFQYLYPIDDPDAVIGDFFYSKGGRVAPGYSNPKLDELFLKQSRTLDFNERKKIVDEIQEIAFQDASRPIIGVLAATSLTWEEVRGWKHWGGYYDSMNMADVWIAK